MNDVSLREYVDALFAEKEKALQAAFAAQEKAVAAALTAAEKAVGVAEVNAKQWREGANEWRGAMTDRERDLYSRREGEALEKRVTTIEATLTKQSGATDAVHRRTSDAARSIGVIVAVGGLALTLVSVVGYLLTH